MDTIPVSFNLLFYVNAHLWLADRFLYDVTPANLLKRRPGEMKAPSDEDITPKPVPIRLPKITERRWVTGK